jgi:hypothetical protein
VRQYAPDVRRKTPREKKPLSLQKDRRNTYGENDKASRIGIPKAKARVNRSNRHSDRQRLDEAIGGLDAEVAAAVVDRVLGRRRKAWRKVADQPLGEVLARKRTDRESC